MGAWSLANLQRDTFPNVNFDYIFVHTVYPGSSAEDVEKLVTIEIERAIKGADGIKKIDGMSSEGLSVIYIEIDPDYEVEKVLVDIKDLIDTIDDFPEDVEVPRVTKMTAKHRGAIVVAVRGEDYKELRIVAKKIRDDFELQPEIARVDLGGYHKDEIRIEIDPVKLNQFELTVADVAQSIKNRNINLSAGKIEAPDGDIMIRMAAEFQNISEIKSVVVRSNSSGQGVKLKDVAKVTEQPAHDAVIQRCQGKQAIFLNVFAKERADIINASRMIKKRVAKFFAANEHPDVAVSYMDDMSYYVKRRLNVVVDNGMIGLILVFGCLMFFLNFRASVITSLGAPIAFMTSFICMYIFGLSINLISMFALILVLGMLVDDSIIVAEHYYKQLEKGLAPKDAALKAAHDTIKPIIATVLTTIIAFGSMFFLEGIMGEFLWMIPLIVIICLMSSLFECFFILPSHLNDFVRLKDDKKEGRWYDTIIAYYRKILNASLKKPLLVLLIAFAMLLGSFGLAKIMRFELFPGDNIRIVFLQLQGKLGAPLVKTDEAAAKVEQMILKALPEKELEQVRTIVGVFVREHENSLGSHYASLILYLVAPNDRHRSTDEIMNEITSKAKKLVPDYSVSMKQVKGGPPQGKPFDIKIVGEDLDALYEVAQQVNQKVSKLKGVLTSQVDYEVGKKQLLVDIDEKEAKRLGLSTAVIAMELRSLLGRDSITEIRKSDEDVEIKIYLDQKSRTKIESLSLLHIINNQGRRIPLVRVAKFKHQNGAFVIRRTNRKRVVSVSGDIDNSKTSPGDVVKGITPALKEVVSKYKNVDYYFGGAQKDSAEYMGGLAICGIIAFVCIFFVLVVMFSSLGQPLVIMSAIPLGMIGVIIAFLLHGESLGFMAVMGVIALVGVVVNDSIVLVNFINIKRENHKDLFIAILEAGVSRFRPVILTTFTTVAGLFPLAYSRGGDPFIKPMALSFAWGLLFSTMVTLLVVPCTYYVYVRCSEFVRSKTLQVKHLLVDLYDKGRSK